MSRERSAETPGPGLQRLVPVETTNGARLNFADLYDSWFDHVARWIHALGAPSADIEDLTQEVFLVVRRRMDSFDGRNVAGWLYRIASRQVWQHRRRSWFKRVITGRFTSDVDDIADEHHGAQEILESKENRKKLETILARMSEKRRVVFGLFEVEGYSGEEIADMLDVPLNTVWTRLYYARKDFFEQLAQYDRLARGAR